MIEYFWVPEDAIFESASEATEFMDLGAGCLVANHVAYDELKAKLYIAVKALKEIDACDDVRLGQTMLDLATDALEFIDQVGSPKGKE